MTEEYRTALLAQLTTLQERLARYPHGTSLRIEDALLIIEALRALLISIPPPRPLALGEREEAP